MALPMDEQRILEEMERMLAADDPKLAARLAAFGHPGFGQVLRSRRARATLSVMVLVLIAAVAAVIYMMSAFRSGQVPTSPGQHSASASARPHSVQATRPADKRVTGSPTAALSTPASQRSQPGGTPLCAGTYAPPCAHWTLPAAWSAAD